jgi:hypothetical protein
MGKPLPWGNKIDSAIKDKYLADGYVYRFCVSFFFPFPPDFSPPFFFFLPDLAIKVKTLRR